MCVSCVSCAADVLAADKQLANEIEFDLRKFEEQEKEKQLRRSSVAVSYCITHTQYLSKLS